MHVSKFCLMKQLNLLHSKKVIAAVDVSNVKVHVILCYWACVLYATHMINVDPSSRKPGSIQETKNIHTQSNHVYAKFIKTLRDQGWQKPFKGACPYCL